jgi:hypothetical protein
MTWPVLFAQPSPDTQRQLDYTLFRVNDDPRIPETSKSRDKQAEGARLGNGSSDSRSEFGLRNVKRSQVHVGARKRDAIKRCGRYYSVNGAITAPYCPQWCGFREMM